MAEEPTKPSRGVRVTAGIVEAPLILQFEQSPKHTRPKGSNDVKSQALPKPNGKKQRTHDSRLCRQSSLLESADRNNAAQAVLLERALESVVAAMGIGSAGAAQNYAQSDRQRAAFKA